LWTLCTAWAGAGALVTVPGIGLDAVVAMKSA
jgi:hypothetical protein